MKEIDYDVLDYLRRTTRLRIQDKIKIRELRENISKLYEVYNKTDHSDLEVDLSEVERLECELRFNALQRELCGMYLDLGEGIGLAEFTNRVISSELEKEKTQKKRKRTIFGRIK